MIIRYKTIATLASLIAFSAQINAAWACFGCGTKEPEEKSKYYPTPSFKGITPPASPATLRAQIDQEVAEIRRAGGIVDQSTELAGGRAVSLLRQLKRSISKQESKKVSKEVAEECDLEIVQLQDMRAQYSPKRDLLPPPFSLPAPAKASKNKE